MMSYEGILKSPISDKLLIKKDSKFISEDKKEEYPIICGIPIIIKKENIKKYFKNEYIVDFKYFKKNDFSFIKSICKKLNLKKKSLILDLGGGEGFYSSCFAQLGMKLIVLDFSKYLLEKGSKQFKDIAFIAGDANEIPLKNDSFDMIFCSGLSLFNTKDIKIKKPLVKHMFSKLKKGGLFVFVHSTNLTGKQTTSWYEVTQNDLNKLFEDYNITQKWFTPRLVISFLFRAYCFNRFSSKNFSFLIRNLAFLNKRIRGRLIYVIKK